MSPPEAGPSRGFIERDDRQYSDHEDSQDGRLSDDELLESLEAELDDDFMASYREQRIEQMRRDADKVKTSKADESYGRLTEIKVEKDVITSTLKNKRTVIHFYHPDFRRCQIMDKHLETLAAKHTGTRFVRADVVNVPFLVVKLEIKVLPCVIAFIDGITKDKIIGFDTIADGGTTDNITTAQLELRLSQSGVIDTVRKEGAMQRPSFA